MKNKFKNTLVFAALFSIFIIVSSCEDDLESKVFSDLTAENFFQTEKDFNAALVALYSSFSIDWGDEDPGVGIWYANLYKNLQFIGVH